MYDFFSSPLTFRASLLSRPYDLIFNNVHVLIIEMMQVAVGAYVGTAALTDFNLATGRSFFPQALARYGRHVWPATPCSQGNIGTGGLLSLSLKEHTPCIMYGESPPRSDTAVKGLP
jgi:hypothetical protein